MSNSVSTSPEQPQASMSFIGRFAGVFFSPGEALADVARKPDFWAPLIVLVIVSVAITETMLAKIGMERIVMNSIEQSGRPAPPPEALARTVQFSSIAAHVAGVVALPIVLLIVAALGLLIVNALLGGTVNFKTAFAVSCYSNLVGVLGGLMGLAMILFGDPEHFNPNAFMPTNLGFFLNPLETSKPLMALATSFDIFTIWWLVLLGVGFSAATQRKIKALTIFMIFFGLWLLWVLAKVGLAAIF
jgi:hypothetical protein